MCPCKETYIKKSKDGQKNQKCFSIWAGQGRISFSSNSPWVWLRREACDSGTSLAEISVHLTDFGDHFDKPQPPGRRKFYFWCASSLRSWLLLLPSLSVGTETFKCFLPLIWGAFCYFGTKQVRGREQQTNNSPGTVSEWFWFTLKKKNQEGRMNSDLGSLSMSRKWTIKSSYILLGSSRCLFVSWFVCLQGYVVIVVLWGLF